MDDNMMLLELHAFKSFPLGRIVQASGLHADPQQAYLGLNNGASRTFPCIQHLANIGIGAISRFQSLKPVTPIDLQKV